MTKPTKFELQEVLRQEAPEALEFQVARAAVEWELACRQIDGDHGPKEIQVHADAHLKLRKLASKFIGD